MTIGGADHGKAIIILNPAEPPILMRNTVYCALARRTRTTPRSRRPSRAMAAEVAAYVPGYRCKGIVFDDGPFETPGGEAATRVSVLLEVTGDGDYLPPYAGQPRHHDRLRGPGRRNDSRHELVPRRTATRMTADTRRLPPHRLHAPRRDPRAPPPVHAGAGRRRSPAPSMRPACRSSRSATATASAAARSTTASQRSRARPDRGGGGRRRARQAGGPAAARASGWPRTSRGRRELGVVGRPDRDPLHRGGHRDPAPPDRARPRDGDGRLPDDGAHGRAGRRCSRRRGSWRTPGPRRSMSSTRPAR